MQDSRINMEDQVFEQALDSIQKEIDDMEAAEIAASQAGKGLGDYDLSAAAATVRKARVAAEQQIAREQEQQRQMDQLGINQEQAMGMLTPEGRAARAGQIRQQYPRQDERKPEFVASTAGGVTTKNGDEEVPVEEKPEELPRMTREEYEKMMKERGEVAAKEAAKGKVEPGQAGFEEKMYYTPEETKEFEAARTHMREWQDKLTPILLEKYPKLKEVYEEALKLPLEERLDFIRESEKYNLTDKQIKDALGEEGYKDWLEATKSFGRVSSFMDKHIPGGYYTIVGEEERGKPESLLYGLRSALLLRAEDEERKTPEEIEEEVRRLSAREKTVNIPSGIIKK